MLDKDLKKKLSVAYILVLAGLGIFTYFSLKVDTVDVTEKESKKVKKEKKPAKVTLQVEMAGTFERRMQNTDSVLSFLDELREEEELDFERTAYIYGSEFDHVNGIPSEEGSWEVFHGKENITHKIDEMDLEDDAVYSLRFIRNAEPQ